jgi:uncharacterized protein involved in outer membrane biogenesis
MDAVSFLKRHRRTCASIVAAIAVILLALLLLVSFGWTWLRQPLAQHFSRQFGRPVTIGAIRRIDHGLFHPVLRITDVRVAQPLWVGGGDMIMVREATVRLPLLPLLFGKAYPRSIDVDGLTLNLVRHDATHANWKDIPAGSGGSGGGSLEHFVIRHGLLTLNDRKRDHMLSATVAADASGLRVAGRGTLAGAPSTLSLIAPAPVGTGQWPFRLDYRSAIANGTLIGRADHPLDIGHFDARVVAWGDNLKHLDLLLEAGLPPTQPVRLTANVRRDRPGWTIRNLALRVGRSNLSGNIAVTKVADRTKIDGDIVSTGLDFDDLASNAGLARAAARRAALGPRIVPDTPIHLEHMRHTDATIRFDVRRLLSKRPSVFRALYGTAMLDHGVLTVQPLTAAMVQGEATGFARVVHRSGTPQLMLDVRVSGARLETIMGEAASGALAAHIALQGNGPTIRAAIADADGHIGIFGHDGAVNRRAALALGSDAGRALFENKAAKAGLRCLIARFDAKSGVATAATLALDTDVSRAHGSGTINLSTEMLALTLEGQPKLGHAVRLHLPIQIQGNLSVPKVVPQSAPKTIGTALTLIGHAIVGDHAEPAPDADCDALATQALR